MAYDERHERARRRDEGGRDWRDADRFGERGERREWTPRPQRLGDRDWRGERDDPDYGADRYGSGAPAGYGADERFGTTSEPDSYFAAPGYDAEFAGPRFDRLDVGSTGTHGVHPVSSFYGAGYRGAIGVTPGGGYGSSARRYAEVGRIGRHDPHYAEWRRRQIAQLDRDFADYRRERQARFDREFGAWRERRGQQRQAVGRVREHMEVVGSDGSHVGTVDCTRGDSIILTKSDPSSGGHHHSIPCGWVDRVDEDRVRLDLTAAEAMERWRDEERSRALFGRDESDDRGPHILNRSFAGTYREGE